MMDWTKWECFQCHKVFSLEGFIWGEVNGEKWCATCLAADLTRIRSEHDELRKAFAPVLGWYEGDGDPTFVEMLTDAVSDLQSDRKEALKANRLRRERDELRKTMKQAHTDVAWLLKHAEVPLRIDRDYHKEDQEEALRARAALAAREAGKEE